jgi:hypothetical protein
MKLGTSGALPSSRKVHPLAFVQAKECTIKIKSMVVIFKNMEEVQFEFFVTRVS